jgi:hypothetical protein
VTSQGVEDVFDEVCQRLEAGETLRQICRTPGFPGANAVVQWAERKPERRERYAHARNKGLDAIAEEILDIADDGRNDWLEREAEAGRVEVALNSEHVQRSRVRIDARKWLLSKLRPDKYGDVSALQLSGPGGGPVEVRTLMPVFETPKDNEPDPAD